MQDIWVLVLATSFTNYNLGLSSNVFGLLAYLKDEDIGFNYQCRGSNIDFI